jgi:hypothetical protein
MRGLTVDECRAMLETESARPLSAAAIAEITRASEGFPIYLRSAAMQIARVPLGQEVDAGAIDVGPESLLSELDVDQMTADDFRCLAVAAAFGRFDADLLIAATGCTGAAARLFSARSIVKRVDNSAFTRSIHDLFQSAVVRAVLESGWWVSPSELETAVGLGLNHLQSRLNAEPDLSSRIDIFAVAMQGALVGDVESSWLRKVAFGLPTVEMAALAVPACSIRNPDGWPAALVKLLSCWEPDAAARYRHRRIDEVIDALRPFPDLYRAALRMKAYSLRGDDRRDEAIEVLSALVEESPINRRLNTYQLALTVLGTQDYQKASDAIASLETIVKDSDHRTDISHLNAMVGRWHGRVPESALLDVEYAHQLRSNGEVRVANEVLGDIYMWNSFVSPQPDAEDLFEEALVNRQFDVARTCLAALALAQAGRPAFPAALARLEQSFAEFPTMRGAFITPNFQFFRAFAFDSAVRRDEGQLAKCLESLAGTRWQRVTELWYRAVVDPESFPDTTVRWAEEESVVQGRWFQLIVRRRTDCGLTS